MGEGEAPGKLHFTICLGEDGPIKSMAPVNVTLAGQAYLVFRPGARSIWSLPCPKVGNAALAKCTRKQRRSELRIPADSLGETVSI